MASARHVYLSCALVSGIHLVRTALMRIPGLSIFFLYVFVGKIMFKK